MERIGRVAGAWMLDNGTEAAVNVAKEGVAVRQRGSVDVAKRRGLVAAVWAIIREVLSVMKSIVENPWVDMGILVVAVAALSRDGGWIRWKDKEDGNGDGGSTSSSSSTPDTTRSVRAEEHFSPVTRTSSAPAIALQSSPNSRITSQQQHSTIDISSADSQNFDPYHLLRASIRDDARFECLALTNRQQADDLERLKRIVSGLRREVGIRDERIARLEGIVEHLQGRADGVEERLGRVEGDVDVMSETTQAHNPRYPLP
ncbi:hypothetical protein HDV00_000076 [Rhizophlyctis rosea]|nr:hypothetical protein HDV00_000076 [Rhizophlyctis rosea]